jgi:hypothetical protein
VELEHVQSKKGKMEYKSGRRWPLCVLDSSLGVINRKMDSQQYKRIMGYTYTTMGLVTLAFPNRILQLSFSPNAISQITNQLEIAPAASLIMRCFGAQATVCGVLITISHFSKNTFVTFGLMMLPFFVFDWMAWDYGMLTPFGAVGDALGNTVFVFCCYQGYQAFNKIKKD